MSRNMWRQSLVVALRLVITVLFVPAILAKLRHPHEWALLFESWGYPGWGASVVSGAEILGLVALWIPKLALAALGGLTITLAGATGTWLIHGPRQTAAYPGTILVLVLLLAWFGKPAGAIRAESAGKNQTSSRTV